MNPISTKGVSVVALEEKAMLRILKLKIILSSIGIGALAMLATSGCKKHLPPQSMTLPSTTQVESVETNVAPENSKIQVTEPTTQQSEPKSIKAQGSHAVETPQTVPAIDTREIQMAADKLSEPKSPEVKIKKATLQQPIEKMNSQAVVQTDSTVSRSGFRARAGVGAPKTKKEKEQECFKAALLDTPVQHYCKCDVNELGNRECSYNGDY